MRYIRQTEYLHVHGYNLHSPNTSSLHGSDEIVKVVELCAGSPDTEPRHVRHVTRLRGTGSAAVDHTGFG